MSIVLKTKDILITTNSQHFKSGNQSLNKPTSPPPMTDTLYSSFPTSPASFSFLDQGSSQGHTCLALPGCFSLLLSGPFLAFPRPDGANACTPSLKLSFSVCLASASDSGQPFPAKGEYSLCVFLMYHIGDSI